METRAHYVLIGSFALAIMGAALLFVLWLGQVERDFDLYDVVFTERVSGLSVGGTVQFNGIKVGEVRELQLDERDPNRVIAQVRVSKGTPVKTDTTAELELVGVTGLAIIQFSGGDPDAPLLKDTVRGTPVIEASASEIQQIIESGQSILASVNQLVSRENLENISQTLANVRILTDAVAERSDDIGATLDDLQTVAASLAAAATSLETAVMKVEEVVGANAETVAADVGETARDISELADSLNALVQENRASLRTFSRDGLGQTPEAMAEARRLINTLDRVLTEIERDPSAFFFGESRPKAEGSR